MNKSFLIKGIDNYLSAQKKPKKKSVVPENSAPNIPDQPGQYSIGGSGNVVPDKPYYHNDAPKDYNYGGWFF